MDSAIEPLHKTSLTKPLSPVIQIKNLTRFFGDKAVLDGCNINISKGQINAIWGRNGSGKTTLLRILATLTSPSHGDVTIENYSIIDHRTEIRQIMGWVPATDTSFFPHLSGYENLKIFSALRKISTQQFEDQLQTWKPKLISTETLKTPFSRCSSGMKQSLLICRALMHKPKILLLDEPTRSLDQQSTQNLYELLGHLNNEVTIVLTTHSESDLLGFKAAPLFLNKGRLTR